jgi:hypothetical protein
MNDDVRKRCREEKEKMRKREKKEKKRKHRWKFDVGWCC